MRKKYDVCPICNQKTELRSIRYLDDQIHAICISQHFTMHDYVCRDCWSDVEKNLRKGIRFAVRQAYNCLMYFYLSPVVNQD